MKQHLCSHRLTPRLILSIVSLPLFFAFSLAARAPAFAPPAPGSESSGKISPLLQQEVDFIVQHPQYDYSIPVIVQVRPDFFARNQTLRRQRGQDTDNLLSGVHGYTARLTGRQIHYLMRSPFVEYVTLDAVIHPTSKGKSPKNVSYAPVSLSTIGADQAHKKGYKGSGVTVAVFDSGVQKALSR